MAAGNALILLFPGVRVGNPNLKGGLAHGGRSAWLRGSRRNAADGINNYTAFQTKRMVTDRPAPPETVKRWLKAKAEKNPYKGPPSKNQRGLLAGKLQEAHKDGEQARRLVTHYVWGWDSLKDERVTGAQVGAMLDWLLGYSEDYVLSPTAVKEIAAIVRESRRETGQIEMELNEGGDG